MSGIPGPDAIEVLICHPHGDICLPLTDWIARGPGPRTLLSPEAAFDARTGARLPLSVIPLRYRNTTLSRLLIALGLLATPWPLQRH